MSHHKKSKEATQEVHLGRPGTHLKIGIVGLPNVGKTTFYNALTDNHNSAENYPFCTIEPSEGTVKVSDERFDWLCSVYKPNREIPAVLNVFDIAGLVKGAHEGKGLGNEFLSNIMACDAIYHLVRCFDDPNISHVEDAVDPIADMNTIVEELIQKDLDHVKKVLEKNSKVPIASRKKRGFELELLERVEKYLEEKKQIRFCQWHGTEVDIINELQLMTAKPQVFLINLSEHDFKRKKNKWLGKIVQWVKEHSAGEPIIPFSAEYEQEQALISQSDEAKAMKSDADAPTHSVFPKVIKTGYSALNLISFYSNKSNEIHAWTVQAGTKAPQAGGVIHSDFEDGFTGVEVFHFDDIKKMGSEHDVKQAGLYRQEGKHYVVQDGDILYFKFNVPSSPGKKKEPGSPGKKKERVKSS